MAHLAEDVIADCNLLICKRASPRSVRTAINHNPQRDEIVDLLDAGRVALHLLPCGVDGLGAPVDREAAAVRLEQGIGT